MGVKNVFKFQLYKVLTMPNEDSNTNNKMSLAILKFHPGHSTQFTTQASHCKLFQATVGPRAAF